MTYRTGIDIGSTTAKLVIVDKDENIVFSEYRRHNTKVYQTITELLENAKKQLSDCRLSVLITGSAGIGMSEIVGIPFIQEVVASTEIIRIKYPGARTLIDIGGEDSKMIFFSERKAPDIRMNGSCAGGTGAFIDQIATLLNIPLGELNALAKQYKHIYPIASRCGVFAKTDVQNLLSRKIPKEDIAASVFHAVAIQALNTLARGFDTAPKVIFSGGPFMITLLRTLSMAIFVMTAGKVICIQHVFTKYNKIFQQAAEGSHEAFSSAGASSQFMIF